MISYTIRAKGVGRLRAIFAKHFKWFRERIVRDRLDSASAHGAFFLIIAFLPFLALVLTLMQRIRFSSGATMIETVLELLPPTVSETIRSLLPDAMSSGGLLPVAIIMAVWASSKAMMALIKSLDQIYEVETARGYIRLRAVSVIYVVLFAVVVLVTAALLVFGQSIYNFLLAHTLRPVAELLAKFKSLVGFLMLLIFFTLMFTFLPRRRIRFVNNLAGAAFGAAGWVLFSFFFSLFVQNFGNFSIYGGLATLVILMYWLFFCMYIMLLGAEVSMWLEFSGIREDLKNRKKK